MPNWSNVLWTVGQADSWFHIGFGSSRHFAAARFGFGWYWEKGHLFQSGLAGPIVNNCQGEWVLLTKLMASPLSEQLASSDKPVAGLAGDDTRLRRGTMMADLRGRGIIARSLCWGGGNSDVKLMKRLVWNPDSKDGGKGSSWGNNVSVYSLEEFSPSLWIQVK